jgi:branched-chain amino acid aminotransferase
MYSSVYGGIVTDPALMMVPVDDHMVHRGDAVFETIKCVGGSLYALRAHLDRLEHSAGVVGQKLPGGVDEIARIVIETVRTGGRRDCLVRLIVSRGPGSFGVNPYDCPAAQVYVVVYRLSPPFMDTHPGGARVRTSAVPAKPGMFAGIKNCNYLPNVLMKKEAVDAGVDFVVGFTEGGLLTEGPTENAGIVTRDGALQFPRLGTILAGTTMLRVMELARHLVGAGELRRTELTDITRADVRQAAEFLIVGTTPNVAAACEFDGQPVGTGRPGPVCAKLGVLLQDDMRNNRGMLTPVF